MSKQTALYSQHQLHSAKIVDFGGWQMPLHYGSQLTEHHVVRRDVGMFDVSHMTIVEIEGAHCRHYLRRLLANDIDKLQTPGKALYSCMLNENGGVVDDLIVYFFAENRFRMVINAATRDKDLAWLTTQSQEFEVRLSERDDLAMIAVQGPNARMKVLDVLGDRFSRADDLGKFSAAEFGHWCIARTGYTGEDGFEIILPNHDAVGFWQSLHQAGVAPCGLGARDTLRLEAGMNLYGQDMTEETTPLESGLAWTVAWQPKGRDFVGREVLQRQQQNGHATLVGLVLNDNKGVLRPHQSVTTNKGEGEITSGSYSPTLESSIAFARVPSGSIGECTVMVRNKLLKATIVTPPFVRNGKARINLF